MKGANIVSQNEKFVELAAATLLKLNYNVAVYDDVVQLSERGRLLTFDGKMMCQRDETHPLSEKEKRKLPPGIYFQCLVDCRWEDLFCRVMSDLAKHCSTPFFVIDNSSSVLDPAKLDPSTISL